MREELKFRYILKHKGKIKTIYATLDEIERGKMDQYLMQKSARFRGEDKLLARDRYTGLQDKNGIEIYEGDVVRYLINSEDFPEEEIREVKIIDLWNGIMPFRLISTRNSTVEIIGNIYENPELVKTAKGKKL